MCVQLWRFCSVCGLEVDRKTYSDCGLMLFRGIRFLSQHCAQRYEMIGELLDREQHDIALLQEVGITVHF